MDVRTTGPTRPTKGGICKSPQEATGTEMTEPSYPPYIGTDQSWGMGTKACNLTEVRKIKIDRKLTSERAL